MGYSNSRYSHSLGLDGCWIIPWDYDDSQQQKEGCEGKGGGQQEENMSYRNTVHFTSCTVSVCIDA